MALIAFLILFFGPYVIYKTFFVHVLKKMEDKFSLFLNNRNIIYNNFSFNLADGFRYAKLISFIILILFFLYTSAVFISHVILLSGYKMLLAFGIFVLPFFFLVFKVFNMCVNALKTKNVSIFEIIEIILFCGLILIFCLFLDEILFYPGSPIKKIPNLDPGPVVSSSVPASDINIATPSEPEHSSIIR